MVSQTFAPFLSERAQLSRGFAVSLSDGGKSFVCFDVSGGLDDRMALEWPTAAAPFCRSGRVHEQTIRSKNPRLHPNICIV